MTENKKPDWAKYKTFFMFILGAGLVLSAGIHVAAKQAASAGVMVGTAIALGLATKTILHTLKNVGKKANIKPRDWAISGGFFVLILGIGIYILSASTIDNNAYLNSEHFTRFNNTFNKYEEFNQSATQLASRTEKITASSGGAFAFLNNLINQGWNTLTSLFDIFSFLNSAIIGLNEEFGIPSFIIYTFISIITLIFAFGILGVIFNRDV